MRALILASLTASSLVAGCGPSGDSHLMIGRHGVVDSAPPGPSGTACDPHHGGRASELRIAGLAWGRLADVYGLDERTGEPVEVAAELVVGPDLASDGRDLEVETHPITGITSVTILHPIGSSGFRAVRERLEAGLVPISAKSLDPAELPPFARVARDAAIVVRVDDLIDPASVTPDAVALWAGDGALQPFPARAFVDANHGGWTEGDGTLEPRFYPTRVILDTTVSEAEALASARTIQLHAAGLPPSRTPNVANVALRIPTRGESVLRNLAGNGPSGATDSIVDATSATLDLVRAFRTGSLDDPYSGLLADTVPPRVVGRQAVHIDAVALDPQGGAQDYVAILTFATQACAQAADSRDVLFTSSSMAVVTRDSPAPVGAQIGRVHLRVVAGGALTTGPAEMRTLYRPATDQSRVGCFVTFSPSPNAPPASRVFPSAQIGLTFSEPMDPHSISPFKTWTVTSVAAPNAPDEYVAAHVTSNPQLDRFVTTPQLPLHHVVGANETYYVNLASGANGPRDAAGNPLQDALPQVPFDLEPSAPTSASGNYVLRFLSSDEDGNGSPELRGQFLYDLADGSIRPRPVMRFAAAATREKPVPSLMPVPGFGTQTPLSPLGSKLQSLWRYCDVGLALLDEAFFNLDVEGLDWAPVGGNVVSDVYAQFEILLSHGLKLPDESLNSTTLLPLFRNSGVVAPYASNVLDPVDDPQKIVHPRNRGYTVNPADRFLSSTTPAVTMMPFPLNRGLPPDQHVFYTWRDTAVQSLGAPIQAQGGPGAELPIVVQATGFGTPGVPYPPGAVPTVGLPLLMEYKCFPDSNALGLNAFDVNIAINSSSLPNFRAFSTGGTNSSGVPVVKNPDAETIATGGFNPNSNPPGQPTLGVDNTFYIGQMDLVTRVSRVHSVWIDTGSTSTSYAPPVVEPGASDEPAGTQVLLAFRGASSTTAEVRSDAGALDAYGEGAVGSVVFFHNDHAWKSNVAQLDGARFLQVRASFVSNVATAQTPKLSGLGLAFDAP